MLYPISKLIIPLITAHLIGDFVLQTDKDVRNKSKPLVLIKHTFLIGLLSYILLGSAQAWSLGLIVFLSHAIIDYMKSRLSKDSARAFFIDQSAHVLIIVIISYITAAQHFLPPTNLWFRLLGNSYFSIDLVVAGAILCIHVGGKVVGFGVNPFLQQLEKVAKGGKRSRGFSDGGRTIGHLERALIYVFVLVNQPAGVGFLIAAKSVFRFGELKESSNRMEAEYIIIGTLSSFLYGILISYIISELLNMF